MNTQRPLRTNERGFASLVVALIMIIVLSLLTVGFARLARREQQNSLDKQLATQAYYAAETGLNDLQKKIPAITAYQVANGTIDKNKCLNSAQLTGIGLSSTIDASTDVSFTCALINLTPPSIVYSGLGARSARETVFSTTGDLDHMTVSWGSHNHHTTFKAAGSKNFSSEGSWGNAPAVLQFTLTPMDVIDRDSLIANTFTAYLYPSSGGAGAVGYTTSADGNNAPVVSGNCSGTGTYTCNVVIQGIQHNVPNEHYMVRMVGYYDTSDISVNTLMDAAGNQLDVVDGQAQIDVTGKAKNVLKRLQIRSPLNQHTITNTLPSSAVDSKGTCKRASTSPPGGSDPGGVTYDTPTAYGTSDICRLDIVR